MKPLAEQYEVCRSNVLPGMVEALAEELGVSADALHALGIGWHVNSGCWTFPERDHNGEIVGIVRRFLTGQKYMVKGSSRGLTFPLATSNTGKSSYEPGKQNWSRSSEEHPCPICGKPDWCLVSAENPGDPKAVICGRVEHGSLREIPDAGYLHIRKPEGHVESATGPLAGSERPILIVEGQTDVAAAFDLGFQAVGRPSAKGGLGMLSRLVEGRSVAVIGERDAGAGIQGMEATFQALRQVASSVVKVLPSEGSKDLRSWVNNGLTAEELLRAIAAGDDTSDSRVLDDISPLYIAELWLKREKTIDGVPVLRKYRKCWFDWKGSCYEEVEEAPAIRGRLYAFLKDKLSTKVTSAGEMVTEPYVANRHKISDIVDALNMTTPVDADPPTWLDGREEPKTENIIVFRNGILDAESYVRGEADLLPLTPKLFTVTASPYEFDPDAECPQWVEFLESIFPGDTQKIKLLQEWFGYNMVTDMTQEKMMLFVGRPRSGKGTVLDVLRAVLGPHQTASTSFQDLCSNFGLQPLVGKLAVFLPDAHIPRQVDASQALEVLKKIVGRDGVDVNRKFLPALADHRLSCRFTIAVNELPDLPDHARALEPRLNILYFSESFQGREDRTLKDRLPKEAPGIAAWALQGLKRLRRHGTFTEPSSSRAVMSDFRRTTTPMAEFVEESCNLKEGEENVTVIKTKLYDAWKTWAKDQGFAAGSRSKFGQRLLALYPTIGTDRRKVAGDTVSVYTGINLTPEAESRLIGR